MLTNESLIRQMITNLGEDATREGLLETPSRAAEAWKEWTKGYSQDASEILKSFEDSARGNDELVIVKNIPFYTHCEHHLAPFFGTATIGYLPAAGRIVGLSKLSRLLDMYAKRLQVQERLTSQVADALQEHLATNGVGVYIKARHLCMESRGICRQGSETVTIVTRGLLKRNPDVRAEFLRQC